MFFSSLALLSGMVLFSKAAPQGWYSSPYSPPYSPPTVAHYVNVSNSTGGLVYEPNFIMANPGDTVSFTFHIKNHSLTQSTFESPCVPVPGGTNTGFHPVAPGTPDTELPVVTFTVRDTSPAWFHCEQGANTAASHCVKGMLFAINPTVNETFAGFQANALASGAAFAASNGTSSNGTMSDWSSSTSSSYDGSTTSSKTSDWSSSTGTSSSSDSYTTTSTTSYCAATTSTMPDLSASSSVTSYWSAPSSSASSLSASSSATY